MDVSLLELRIRSLPGVVACQLTATSVLVLVGPDGDGPAVNAAIVAMLDQAASDLAVQVLAVPPPTATGTVPLWRRKRAGLAFAGSAAALSATVAAAATLGVITFEPAPAPGPAAVAPATDDASSGASPSQRRIRAIPKHPAPAAPTSAATAVESVEVELAATVTEVADGTERAERARRHLNKNAAAPGGPVLLEIPLPAPVAAVVTSSVPTVNAASTGRGDEDAPPHGRARRVRHGIEERTETAMATAPAPHASPVATNEGERAGEFAATPPRSSERGNPDGGERGRG